MRQRANVLVSEQRLHPQRDIWWHRKLRKKCKLISEELKVTMAIAERQCQTIMPVEADNRQIKADIAALKANDR